MIQIGDHAVVLICRAFPDMIGSACVLVTPPEYVVKMFGKDWCSERVFWRLIGEDWCSERVFWRLIGEDGPTYMGRAEQLKKMETV